MKNEIATTNNNNNVSNNVAAIMAVVSQEATSTRAIVDALWQHRNNDACREIATVLFADVHEDTARKVMLTAGCKRLQALWPAVIITDSGRPVCAKRYNVAANIYAYREVGFLPALELALTNYYNGGRQIVVDATAYYDNNNDVVTLEAAAAAIKQEDEAKKEKKEAAKARAAQRAVDKSDIATLLDAARKQAVEGSELYNAIVAAIKLI